MADDRAKGVGPLPLGELLDALPHPWPGPSGLSDANRERLVSSGGCIAVLDDDPTGCQTVHGVEVLLDWDDETVADALSKADTALYLLTNTRGMVP